MATISICCAALPSTCAPHSRMKARSPVRSERRRGGWVMGRPAHRGLAHHHQLERTPAQQLHDVEQHRQAREAPAQRGVHQPRAGQAAGAADVGHPAQQRRAQQRAGAGHPQRAGQPQRGGDQRAHLQHQQAHAQAEPQRGVVVPAEHALGGGHGAQRLVGGEGGECHRPALGVCAAEVFARSLNAVPSPWPGCGSARRQRLVRAALGTIKQRIVGPVDAEAPPRNLIRPSSRSCAAGSAPGTRA
jgi:hypothetical protein